MPRPDYASSISIKFEIETVNQLRKEALENQRSLSGQVRHLIYKHLQPKDSDTSRSVSSQKKEVRNG